jgi:hypothetical protein
LALHSSPGFPDRSAKNLARDPEEGEKEGEKEIGNTKKFPKSLYVILKDQSLEKRLPGGCAKKGMVLLFSHINADEQILRRSSNFFPELTKLFQSATIFLVHKKPPV